MPTPVTNDIMAVMPTRRPGDGRYSLIEREQRWVLRAVPTGLLDPIEINDRYIRDTDLRLRRMKSADEVIWKLGQKTRVRAESPGVVNLTNIYLREHEYQVLEQLQAATLVKTRRHWRRADRVLSVDEFHGRLTGLVLAEIELEADDGFLGLPEGAIADVTHDDRFSGGSLASLDERGAVQLLAEAVKSLGGHQL
jgi:CYTH domain-containing protein